MQTKICTTCKIKKEISEFHKDKSKKFGVRYICKYCLKNSKAKRKFLIPNGFKLCSKCDKEKILSEFSKDNAQRNGLSCKCNQCRKAPAHNYYLLNKETILNHHKKYWSNYYMNNKKKEQDRQLHKKYGITLNEYNTLLKEQNNVCNICGKRKIINGRSLAVDHNHKTGKVRGLLCGSCNRMLGLAKDNIKILKSAIKYLRG